MGSAGAKPWVGKGEVTVFLSLLFLNQLKNQYSRRHIWGGRTLVLTEGGRIIGKFS